MTQPVNPYVAGAPLRGERGFFGRRDILGWVARGLRNPTTNALVLFGQHLIGKTSLLLQLQRTLSADIFLPVYFDVQDQATRPLGQVLADLADTVAERADLEPPDPDAFDDRGRFFRRTFLSQLYQALGESRRPVFLLDEFDVLDQAAEAELPEVAAAKALFPFLRRVMIEDPCSAFVFVLGRRAEDLSLDFTAIFKAALMQEIWVLDRASVEALVRQAEANGTLCFTDHAMARILSLTSGHPYFAQLLCQRIWEQAYIVNPVAPPCIDMSEVEAAVPDALEAGQQALVWLWNRLSPAEQIYAVALTEIADEGMTIPEDRVIQVLTTHAVRLRTREVELAPRDLVKRRVLEEVRGQGYRFAVEFFRRWVRHYKPMRSVKDDLDQVEPMADSIFRIGWGFFERRRWETAVHSFRNALEANPHHFRALLRLGEALLEQGKVDDAVTELGRAYELDRDEARLSLARALVAQAKAREEAGDEDSALAACEQALQISPNERAAQEIRTAIWIRRGYATLEEMPTKGEKPMSTITWLHLSDLHFRTSQTYASNIVLKALLRDIAERIRNNDLQPDFFLLSGDIAFASQPKEYALAQQFLDDLLETTDLPKDRLFLVPGNHDVDRNAISTLSAGATAVLNNRDAVNRFLTSDADRALVFQRFHNYQDFINECLGEKHLPFNSTHYFYVKHIEVASRRLAILGLNSTWLSASDEDRNQLLLGERQVRAALDAIEDADLRLAVMHHPFDWLQDFDRDDVKPLLCSGCDFVLHGHMHQVSLLQDRTPDTDAMIIAAGACYETRQYPNSYNFVQLNLSTGKGTVYLRMFSPKQGGFWTKDVVSYRNVDDGMYTFSLPDRLRL